MASVPYQNLLEVCKGFYTDDEVVAAKNKLFGCGVDWTSVTLYIDSDRRPKRGSIEHNNTSLQHSPQDKTNSPTLHANHIHTRY